MINLHRVDSFKEKEKLHIKLDIILDKLFALQAEIKKELEYEEEGDDIRKGIAIHTQKLLVDDYQKKCNELTLDLTGQYLFTKHDRVANIKTETALIL